MSNKFVVVRFKVFPVFGKPLRNTLAVCPLGIEFKELERFVLSSSPIAVSIATALVQCNPPNTRQANVIPARCSVDSWVARESTDGMRETIFRFPELDKKFTTVCWGNTALKLYNFIERTSLGRLLLSISFSF